MGQRLRAYGMDLDRICRARLGNRAGKGVWLLPGVTLL